MKIILTRAEPVNGGEYCLGYCVYSQKNYDILDLSLKVVTGVANRSAAQKAAIRFALNNIASDNVEGPFGIFNDDTSNPQLEIGRLKKSNRKYCTRQQFSVRSKTSNYLYYWNILIHILRFSAEYKYNTGNVLTPLKRPESPYTVYTDASCSETGGSGFGFAILGANGGMYLRAGNLPNNPPVHETEVLAVQKAIKYIRNNSTGKIKIKTDWQQIKYAFDEKQPTEGCCNEVRELGELVSTFTDIEHEDIPRAQNHLADALSAAGRFKHQSFGRKLQ